jgi:hypothetical protein
LKEKNTGLGRKAGRFTKLMVPENSSRTLITNKVEFKHKLLKRDKDGHFILIKGEIHQEEPTIINLYTQY